MNHEQYELYNDVELARRVKIQRLRWLAYAFRMDGQAPARRVFETDSSGRSGRRRSSRHLRDQLEDGINSLGISNFRQIAGRKSDWRVLLLEAKTDNRL